MRAAFADTCYWIALLDPTDQTHHIALRASKGLTGSRIVTTEEVLTEVLNYFGSRGPYWRSAAAKLVERMQSHPSIQVLAQSRESFLAGFRLYQARPDKDTTLTLETKKMHFDLAHAAVAAILIFVTIWILRKTGISKPQEAGHHQWDWKIFFAVFLVMFVFNIIWPFQ